MAETMKVNVDIKLNSGKNCPHMEIERVRAAQLRQLCPLCVFQDLLASSIKTRALGMKPDAPTPKELGLPKPPKPPLIIEREIPFFQPWETEESKLFRARYEGASDMWQDFMDALYPGRSELVPIANPNPAAADRIG